MASNNFPINLLYALQKTLSFGLQPAQEFWITSFEIIVVRMSLAEICFKISFDCILDLVLGPKHDFRVHLRFTVVKVVSIIGDNRQQLDGTAMRVFYGFSISGLMARALL